MAHYVIEQAMINGTWENTLIDENDDLIVFETLKEAHDELLSHFEHMEEAVTLGYMTDFDTTHWRIRQVD